MKLLISLTALNVALGYTGAQAQHTHGTNKIDLLNDILSAYADHPRDSLIAARMAVEDFGAARRG